MKFNDFKKSFYQAKNKKEILGYVKGIEGGIHSLLKFVNRIEKEMKSVFPLFNRVLMGANPFPKSYKEIGSDDRFRRTDSVELELNWLALSLIKEKDLIQLFCRLKNIFEINLLNGNYSEARIVLEDIEKQVSISHWSVEQRLILDEYQFGSEENWETRNLLLAEENTR